MDLTIDKSVAKGFTSKSQIARVLTESWVKNNSYCPSCGWSSLEEFPNNRPVADYYCSNCNEEFELKSKNGKMGRKIVDGAYNSMIDRINAYNNPNFFFLNYDSSTWSINNFLIIPKHFFTNSTIEKRKPLAETAKRAGWVGCNIVIDTIPNNGKVFLVKDKTIVPKSEVISKWKQSSFLADRKIESRGWLIDILNCVDKIPKDDFSLHDIYTFENELSQLHPNNKFVRDKIRQQLQILRDRKLIEFVTRGNYRKIK